VTACIRPSSKPRNPAAPPPIHVDEEARDNWLSPDLAGVALPVDADIPPAIDIAFIDEFDAHTGPLGAKGIRELSATGIAAAVANAVFDATGKRVRELPIPPTSCWTPPNNASPNAQTVC
jgi:CO/xanthine dehydrogenase Mo-binding subunit